jgi:REP element-mobilizing transposase RayT
MIFLAHEEVNGFKKRQNMCFLMHVHLVFVTKYRRKVFTKQILVELRSIFIDICSNFEAELIEFEGEGDHVHLLVNYPPKVTISKLVNSLKGVSSRLIRKNNIQAFNEPYGKTIFGLRAILQEPAEVRHFLSFDNILNSKILL